MNFLQIWGFTRHSNFIWAIAFHSCGLFVMHPSIPVAFLLIPPTLNLSSVSLSSLHCQHVLSYVAVYITLIFFYLFLINSHFKSHFTTSFFAFKFLTSNWHWIRLCIFHRLLQSYIRSWFMPLLVKVTR